MNKIDKTVSRNDSDAAQLKHGNVHVMLCSWVGRLEPYLVANIWEEFFSVKIRNEDVKSILRPVCLKVYAYGKLYA